jgi:hypothetical protein
MNQIVQDIKFLKFYSITENILRIIYGMGFYKANKHFE